MKHRILVGIAGAAVGSVVAGWIQPLVAPWWLRIVYETGWDGGISLAVYSLVADWALSVVGVVGGFILAWREYGRCDYELTIRRRR